MTGDGRGRRSSPRRSESHRWWMGSITWKRTREGELKKIPVETKQNVELTMSTTNTADAGKTTGCFDLFCKGFVHTSEKIGLGTAIEPTSVEFGPQYKLSFFIYLNWFLRLGDIILGYWPGELFSLMKRIATNVRWGGEVYSPTIRKPGVPHTATTMGSGEYASTLYGLANFIFHVRIVDYSNVPRYPEWVSPYAEEPDCYSAYNYVQYTKEPEFYFGGPGKGPLCP